MMPGENGLSVVSETTSSKVINSKSQSVIQIWTEGVFNMAFGGWYFRSTKYSTDSQVNGFRMKNFVNI